MFLPVSKPLKPKGPISTLMNNNDPRMQIARLSRTRVSQATQLRPSAAILPK